MRHVQFSALNLSVMHLHLLFLSLSEAEVRGGGRVRSRDEPLHEHRLSPEPCVCRDGGGLHTFILQSP